MIFVLINLNGEKEKDNSVPVKLEQIYLEKPLIFYAVNIVKNITKKVDKKRKII